MKFDHDQKSELARLLADAQDSDNVGKRADLLDRYLCEPYGDEVEGRSAFVTSEVADAVEAILPDVMDVFTSAGEIVEFSPVGPDDEDAAKQETKAVSNIFWQKNEGFSILYTWIKEALIQQNSYVSYGWVEKERVTIEEYAELTPDELFFILDQLEGDYDLQEQAGFTIVEGEGDEDPKYVFDGSPISIKVRCSKKEKKFEIEPFPQEDFLITPRWTRISLEGVPVCGRRHRDITREDLIAMGFSKKSVDTMSEGEKGDEGSAARHETRDTDEGEATTKTFDVYQVFARMDINGDDVTELVEVWCGKTGSQILERNGRQYEEVSAVNITALTPYIMPHRHIGRSVTEQVDDLQRLNTVLMRQLLDNIYLTNYGRPYFDENNASKNTYDDLLNPAPGAPVRTSGGDINWYTPPSLAGHILPVMEKSDTMKEQRVGATRYNQGLDAESLNKTMGGMKMIMNASQKKAKLIARTIAETGLRDLFLGIHRELRAGPMKSLVMRLSGKWVDIDPRTWTHRTEMTVNVGMGRGDRDEIRAFTVSMGQVQRELMQSGSRLVGEREIYNTVAKAAGTFGVESVDPYIQNPEVLGPPPPPPPPPPDAMLIAAQSDAQKKMADAQRDAARLASDDREKERRFQLEMEKLRIEGLRLANQAMTDEERLELDRKKAVMADDLERDKLAGSEPPVSYDEVLS